MLKRLAGRLLIGALVFLSFFRPHMVRAEEVLNTPIIGEVAWAGSSMSTADEWIELWNTASMPVSLEGYELRGAGSEPIVFDETHVIAPGSAFLLANYSAQEEKTALAVEPDLVTTAVALSNASLMLELVAPDGSVIDTVGDGGAPPAGSSSPLKTSMIRTAEGWKPAEASENFKESVADLGTPGICDGCAVANDQQQTMSNVEESVAEASPNEQETIVEAPAAQVEIETTSSTEAVLQPEPEEEIPIVSVQEAGPQFPEIDLKISGVMEVEQGIFFDAASSSDPNGDIVYFSWDFGDGLTATGSRITHAYATSGRFLFELIATDTTFRTYATGVLEIMPAPLPPPEILLNEIHPAPESGAEWVELYAPDLQSLDQLDGWRMDDASGTVFRFTENTRETLEYAHPFVFIPLSSAKLNNSGDQVLLIRADGSAADAIEYGKTKKGESWIRFPDGASWTNGVPTPIAENEKVLSSPPQAHAATIEVQEHAPNTQAASNQIAPITITDTAPSPESPKTEEKGRAQVSLSMSETPKTTAKPVSIAKVSTPAKTSGKTTNTKTEPEPPVADPSIAHMIPSNTRIRIHGTVGTKPGILSKRHFVLLAKDGRGIRIKGSNKQASPEFGSYVSLTGTLMLNDDGLYVQMGSKDRWEPAAGEPDVVTRAVNLLDPSPEDEWNLLNLEASVIETKTSTVLLEADGIPILLSLRPPVGYRASRLKPGDLVQVVGLIQTHAEELRIYPRSADEIEIVRHAALVQEQKTPSPFPDWAPFGAAGITVAAAEGFKRVRKWRREKKIRALIEEAKQAA